MSEFDSKALASAREVLDLTRQAHIGGDAQLLAKIQLLFVDAMEYAAPKSFGNSEKVNSPVRPDGWIKCSEQLPESKPGCYEYIVYETLNNRAHHDYFNVPDKGDNAFTPFWNHYGDHVTHWQPLPAAPKQESE